MDDVLSKIEDEAEEWFTSKNYERVPSFFEENYGI